MLTEKKEVAVSDHTDKFRIHFEFVGPSSAVPYIMTPFEKQCNDLSFELIHSNAYESIRSMALSYIVLLL